MAENQLRRIDVDFGDDDPFAELKQIMGFEQPNAVAKPVDAPKVAEPTRSAAPEAMAPNAAALQPAPETDDFAIDLEEELLAGFRSEIDTPAATPVAAPAATIDLDAWVAEAVTPVVKQPVPSAAQPVAIEPMVVDPVHAEPVLDDLPEEEFDAAFAVALDSFDMPTQDDFAGAVTEPVAYHAPEAPVSRAAAPEPVAYRMPARPADSSFDFAPESVADGTGGLDAALAAEFERDLTADEPLAALPASAEPVAYGMPARPADPFFDFAPEPVADDTDGLDAALAAEFERDLTADAPSAAIPDLAEPVAYRMPVQPAEASFDFAPQPLGDDTEGLDAALAAEFERDLTADAPSAALPVSTEPTSDFSFEAEDADAFDASLGAAFERDLAAEAVPAPVVAAARQPAQAPELAFEQVSQGFGDIEPALDSVEPGFDPVELGFDHDELMRDLDDVLAALPPSEPTEVETVTHAQAAADPVQQEIDLDFDVAMAEVDMEFGSDEPELAAASQPDPFAAQQAEVAELDDFAVEDIAPRAAYEPEIATGDQRYAAYDQDMVEPVAAVAASAPAAEPELSFEDELKALLGRPVEPAVLTSDYDTSPLAASWHDETATTVADEAPDWGAAPAAESQGRLYARADDRADETKRQIDAEFDSILSSMTNPSAYRTAEPEVRSYEDEAPEFDDHAFEAAFETALAGTEHEYDAVAPAMAAPADDLDREIETYYRQGQDISNKHGQGVQPAHSRSNGARAEAAPQVETIDVPEAGVAVTDELDIPELVYEDDVRPASAYDDFEPDFSEIFNEPAEPARGAAVAQKGAGQRLKDDVAEYEYALATTAAATAAINAARQQPAEWEPDYAPEQPDAYQGRAATQAPEFDDFDALEDRFDEPAYDDDTYGDPAAYGDQEPAEQAPSRRGYMIAAVVGGIALLGAAGAFALSFNGDSAADGPAVVRADPDPIKVRPENPGGSTVPNADNKVFESMAGTADTTSPSQEKLIPSSEEPVDLSARTVELAPVEDELLEIDEPVATGTAVAEASDEPAATAEPTGSADEPTGTAMPTGKAEDRVAPTEERSADAMEVAAVQPRRVKTLIVRSDGTLVPREEPTEAAPAATETLQPTALEPAKPVAETPAPATEVAALEPARPVETAKPVEAAKATEPVAEKPAETATPDVGPVASARPSDQPVDIVGEVAPERVATVAPAGGWSVQIASQPSEEAARSTYGDLSRRYASVIGGKPASIVKAEIPNKGTFWRVRIAADSRADAIGLCENYKSAGGNCFVSK
jgi:hypothetical protein